MVKWILGPHFSNINFNPIFDNHMPSKVWDDITYLFPNFNGCTIDVWECIINFIPHSMMYAITYPC